MSGSKPGRSKKIRDSFSFEQPGQINVAGEVFFLNLKGEKDDTVTEKLFDDSVKGDNAFQILFLGGKPKGPENETGIFTLQEQVNLRRIFRAVFGVTVARKKIGSETQLRVPCSKVDRELMVKALEYRRRLLIQQTIDYDKLASADIHSRYLRDHLLALKNLIEDQIPNSKASCVFTDVIDPTKPRPLKIDDDRMRRLLEIFAYLLAQGNDPLVVLSDKYPMASELLPMMAQADAPDIYDYERFYPTERSGKSPEYSETLKRIRKVLESDADIEVSVINDDLKKTIEEIEGALGLPSTGDYKDRQKAIREKLANMKKEIDDGIANMSKLESEKAKLLKEKADVEAAKKVCDDALAEMKAKGTVPKSEFDALQERATQLQDILDGKNKLIAENEKELKELRTKLAPFEELKNQKAVVDARLKEVNAELAALKAKYEADTRALKDEIAGLKASVVTITAERDTARGESAAKDTTIGELRAEIDRLTAELGTRITVEEANRLRERVAELEPIAARVGDLERQVREITEDRDRIKGLYDALNDAAGEVLTPERVRALIDRAALVPELRKQLSDKGIALLEATSNVSRLERRVRALEEENRRLRDRPEPPVPEDLRPALEEAQRKLADAERELTEARAQVTRATGEVTLLREQLREAEEARRLAQETADAATARAAAAEGRVAELDATITDLRRQLDARPTTAELEELRLELRNKEAERARAVEERDTALRNTGELKRQRDIALGDLQRERIQKDARIRRLVTERDLLQTIFTRINTVLQEHGLPQIPEDYNEAGTTEAIHALGARLAEPPVPGPEADRNQTLCLLNILYHLLKRTFINLGDSNTLDFRPVFTSLEQAAQQDTDRPANEQKLGQNVIDYFFLLPKYAENTLTPAESQQFGAIAGNLLQFYRITTPLEGPVDALGTIMFEQFFPRTERGVRRFETLPFVLLMAFTKKLLIPHEADLDAIGCRIPEPLVQPPPPPPPPPPEPVVPAAQRCEERTPVELATAATPNENKIRLTTFLSEKLRRFPFCLDVKGWTEYVKSDLQSKAATNLLNAYPVANAEREEKLRQLRSTSFRIEPDDERGLKVTLLGGAKTRKRRAHASKKNKTYKVSK